MGHIGCHLKKLAQVAYLVVVIGAISVVWLPGRAGAQSLLPEGIIAWQAGYRSYKSQSNAFDSNFQLRPIGADYTISFNNDMLLSGKAGKDLQRLATVLESVGDPSETRLDLGVLKQHVSADLSASIFGLAYGASPDLTIFFGVPWTTADVKNTVEFSGTNNSLAILDKLGNMAFDELRQGLEKASLLDAATIRSSIESENYGPIDRWQYSGIGDFVIGAKTGFNIEVFDGMPFAIEYSPSMNLPTGHSDDPDLINDVALGKGYIAIAQSANERIHVTPFLLLGLDQMYSYNFDARVQRRVPEDSESVVAANRKTNVLQNPGDDYELGIFLELGSGMLRGNMRVASHRHFSDKYSGSVVGNYEKLSSNSDTELITHEVGVTINTVDAYQRKEFMIPLMARLTASFPLTGYNSPNFEYYEFSLTSFLDPR